MNEKDYETTENMEKYGGSFVRALGDLAKRADAQNLRKIKETWTEYWKQYENFNNKEV